MERAHFVSQAHPVNTPPKGVTAPNGQAKPKLFPPMADQTIVAANVAASNTAEIRREYPAGATMTQGQLVYLDATNRWQLADSDAAATGNLITDLRGITLGAGANGQPMSVVTKDNDFTPGHAVTNGVPYFGSPNAGNISNTAPASGNYAVFLGVGKSTTKINLNPTASGVVV